MYAQGIVNELVEPMNKNSDTLASARATGMRLRDAREARGLSLSQLAGLTGDRLSKSRISNYEQGLRRLPVDVSRTLAAALGNVSAVELLCMEQDCPGAQGDEAQLLRRFREADPTARRRILEAAGLSA
ncbi:MAG: helix-turn-helix transcriptional regulator [Thiohalocapsa sp.]